MPQLLLELFSEEIPARMQQQAARDLARMAKEHLAKAGLNPESLAAYSGPRRLTLVAEGLPTATPDRTDELKGPRANAPAQALDGFLRKTGLTRADLTERDGVLFAAVTTPGRATPDIIAEMVPAIVAGFPWPKSMRSGASSFRWVRPLQRILCLFDGRVVPFAIEGVVSGDVTEGHRFMGAPGPVSVTDYADYKAKLFERSVVLDPADRRRLILEGARAVCAAEGLELVEDEGLLEEVAGLAEWPVPILGHMDPAFLDLPAEVIRTSMRTHQKYFAVRQARNSAHPRGSGDPEQTVAPPLKPGSPLPQGRADEERLAPNFVVVANIAPMDGGAVIAAGNAKVLSARLNDARFFWDQDQAPGAFDKWLEKLNGVTFHAKLGTMKERVERIEALAVEIAPLVGADVELTRLAARYCKADLASGMVGEFPELQGVMGGYYMRAGLKASSFDKLRMRPSDADGESRPHPEPVEGRGRLTDADVDQIADAIRDHYKPVGPSDTVPTAPVTVAVALADKLDTLGTFWWAQELPTGSRDPYALRRAALGMIRIQLENALNFDVLGLAAKPITILEARRRSTDSRNLCEDILTGFAKIRVSPDLLAEAARMVDQISKKLDEKDRLDGLREVVSVWASLRDFTHERLQIALKDRYDVDVIRAASRVWETYESWGPEHPPKHVPDPNLVRITRRVEALSDFLATEDGATLLAGYKRAVNILKAEEKKKPEEADLYRLNPELGAMTLDEERALAAALRTEVGAVDDALAAEDFTRAMTHLAALRAPVDAFFDKVLVNDPDPEVRMNRLRLLTQVRDTANRVADFSLISG